MTKTNPCEDEEGEKVICLELDNEHDMGYMAQIAVGNPPQNMSAVFDTGSSNTWILGAGVLADKAVPAFNESLSETVEDTDQAAEITFGSGSLQGHFVYDDFRVGDIKITDQMFGFVEHQSTIFDGTF